MQRACNELGFSSQEAIGSYTQYACINIAKTHYIL